MTRAERIERIKLWLFKCALRGLVALEAYDLIVRAAVRHVTERANKENVPFTATGRRSGKNTVLVLDRERFRGDLDIFSQSQDVRILCMSWPLLRHLLASFVYQPTFQEREALPPGVTARLLFAKAAPGTKMARERERYRVFLREFLPRLYERLGVDMTMNSDYRFRREHDVIQVGEGLGYPHSDGAVAPEILEQRRDIFARHVSPLSADATGRSLELINRLASQGRDRRRRGSAQHESTAAETGAGKETHAHICEGLAPATGPEPFSLTEVNRPPVSE